jgi:hypothetical protein
MKVDIIKLCAVWRNNTAHLPVALQCCADWGPPEDEISDALQCMKTLDLDTNSMADMNSDSELSDEGVGSCDDLDYALDLMDMMQIGGVQEEMENTDWEYEAYDAHTARTLSRSPKKRGRHLEDE